MAKEIKNQNAEAVVEAVSKTEQFFNENGKLLETCSNVASNQFEVFDNRITETDVPVKLYEADAYIQDYYALKAIWESLDGENWYYIGENYPSGTNWNFNTGKFSNLVSRLTNNLCIECTVDDDSLSNLFCFDRI